MNQAARRAVFLCLCYALFAQAQDQAKPSGFPLTRHSRYRRSHKPKLRLLDRRDSFSKTQRP
jgi:hypothetical protein